MKNDHCGPKVMSKLIPDRLLGLNVSDVCERHDANYIGVSKSRHKADLIFLRDLLHKINTSPHGFWVDKLRQACAYGYFFSVRLLGWVWYGNSRL